MALQAREAVNVQQEEQNQDGMRCIVFHVKYELDLYMLCRRK
jgi:hypothetical protein